MNTQARDKYDDVDNTGRDAATAGDEQEELEDDGFDIEIVDDVDPGDKPRRAEDAPAEIPSDDDLEGYSEKVKKRLRKLTFEAKEAERQRQAALRERDEAVTYARQTHEEAERLRKQAEQGQTYAVEQGRSRAEAQLAAARDAYKRAYDAGDSDALLEAQQNLNTAQYDLSRYEAAKKQAEARAAELQQRPQQPAPQAPPPPQAQPQPQMDTRQKEWLAENDWFGKDQRMTGYALGVHSSLEQEGVEIGSEKYYAAINTAMRETFPGRFSAGDTEVDVSPRKPRTVVAPAARAAPSPRKVKLTSSQVALAKRLGVTPEAYAKQMLALSKGQDNG